MALHITDVETDRLVRQLAETRGIGLTEAIKLAVQHELKAEPLAVRLRPLQDRIQAKIQDSADRPRTDEEWKAFYDDLEGDTALPFDVHELTDRKRA